MKEHMDSKEQTENIAATLARVLPTAEVIHTQDTDSEKGAVIHLAIPKSMDHKAIDTEALLANPRRAKGTAAFDDLDSFVRYMTDFAKSGSTVWCNFNPQTHALEFTGVIDEHSPDKAGWRGHRATFIPAMSAEWKTWLGQNKVNLSQVGFAEFIESNEPDFHAGEGLPTSLQMKGMATEFVVRQDMGIKSSMRLQDGGVKLEYINNPDAGTTEAMKVFERFAIAIPVFWTPPEVDHPDKGIKAYIIDARLRYRLASQKVTFFYELIRPDRVHQKAAVELIEAMRTRLATASVQLLMGGMRA